MSYSLCKRAFPEMIYRNAIAFAFKRLWSHRWLSIGLVLGLLVSVALATAIPVYSDGINASILRTSLSAGTGNRQPFDFVFRYIGSWYGDVSQDQYQPADTYLSEQAAAELGLPSLGLTRYFATANLQLYPNAENLVSNHRLDRVKLAFLTDVFDHIQLVEGNLPRSLDESGETIEVLAALDLANALNLQVGQTYALFNPANGTVPAYRQEVTISGLWIANDPESDFWALYPSDSFQKKLLVPEDSWWAATQALPAPVDEAAWRLALDGSGVNSDRVGRLLARIDAVQNRANAILSHTDLETSPAPALRQYRSNAQALTGSLFAFSAPVLGLALFFLSLIARMFVRSQHSEIAVLRSRGAPRTWILAVYLVEWGILGLGALVLGLPAGLALARLVGRTRSFLDFSSLPAFTPQLSLQSVALALLAVLLGIAFCLLPVWQSGRDTVVSYKQERARTRRKPLWQRMYLDGVCLVPALYGWYTLRAQGRLSLLGRAVGSTDPFQNPLLFLLPTLFLVGVSLLIMRLLPPLLDGLAALAARLPGVTATYVLRQFARSGSTYQGVLLLTALTIGLATFVASEAHSLDQTLQDSIYYATGADLNLAEGGEFVPDTSTGSNDTTPADSGLWNFLPISDHLNLPGVQAAARVGSYTVSLSSGGRNANGQIMGIDTADFSQVAFFRDDFAAESLNGLLNRLSSSPDALLVDQGTWERFNLNTGDTLELRIEIGGQATTISFTVAGVFTRFPTWKPDQDGALFVTNLDTIFESLGSLQPYAVWLRTTPAANTAKIVEGINQMGVAVVTVQDARAQVAQAFQAPGRQGVLGMLSVGFLASSALTLVGVFLYTLFSFRERFIQLGVLRAIGLSVRQMRTGLAAELAFLVLSGTLIGTGVGVLAVHLFVPYLPVSIGAGVETLSNISQVAWGALGWVYLLFGLALLAGITALVVTLRRMSIFQAVKLGETV
jgi:putative ABC transport system permease protein